jgi:hypothetical protein
MFNNLEEEVEFFSTSPELVAHIQEFDGEKIIVVDNFWKYPDKVRQLVQVIPPTCNPRIIHGLPGKRVEGTYYFSHLGEVFDNMIRHVYPEDYAEMGDTFVQNCIDHASLLVNVQNSNLPPRVPHIDNPNGGRFAVGIYLNTPEECSGGTAFYKYKGEKTIDLSDLDVALKDYDYYVQESDGEHWEKIHLAEMKYNRMVIYKQNILHTPYILPNTFTDEKPRLMQMFFI